MNTTIETSSELGKLAEALAKAQAEMPTAPKDARNPHFKNLYASFESVVATWKQVGPKHGFSITQLPTSADGSTVGVVTMLMHSSGQWIRSTLTMRPAKADPQGIGSAISYAKRYAYAAIVGMPTGEADDDAEMATNGNGRKHDPPARQAAPAQNNNAPDLRRMLGEALTAIKECRNTTDLAELRPKLSEAFPAGSPERAEAVAAFKAREAEVGKVAA